MYTLVETFFRTIRPISVYTATAIAAASARKSPYRCTPPADESAYAISKLPTKVIPMANMAFFDIFPFKNIPNPKATQITSVQTIDVELATDVCNSDSNHNTKWTARNSPLSALSANSFFPT